MYMTLHIIRWIMPAQAQTFRGLRVCERLALESSDFRRAHVST